MTPKLYILTHKNDYKKSKNSRFKFQTVLKLFSRKNSFDDSTATAIRSIQMKKHIRKKNIKREKGSNSTARIFFISVLYNFQVSASKLRNHAQVFSLMEYFKDNHSN